MSKETILAEYAALLGKNARTILEIGTHLGDTAIILAKHSPDHVYVYTVDVGARWEWEGRDLESYADFLQKKFEGQNIFFLLGYSHFREDSHIVPWGLGGIDLLFIDGDHNYDAVMSDLIRWASKVMPGGYMILHDYVAGEEYKVYGACEDYIHAHLEWEELGLEGTTIVFQKEE